MKQFRIFWVVFFILIVCATTAHAQEKPKGRYFSLSAGLSLLSDSDLTVTDIEFATVTSDPGFNIGGAFGYDFGNVRVEGELMYRMNDLDTGTIPGTIGGVAVPGCPCTGPVEGDVSTTSFMANGYYDLDLAGTPWEPYLGVGLGFANVSGDIDDLGDDSDIVFAYQFLAGIGYSVNPRTIVSLGYRYFGTTNPEFEAFGVPFEAEIQYHEFNAGIRVAF